jgi:hypothetical protein
MTGLPDKAQWEQEKHSNRRDDDLTVSKQAVWTGDVIP